MGGNAKYQPTLKELLAYKRGELSPEKTREIEKALEGNSMLSAALAGIELTDIGAAENISRNVSDKINSTIQQPNYVGVSKFSIAIVSTLIILSITGSILIGSQMVNQYTVVDPELTKVSDILKTDSLIDDTEKQEDNLQTTDTKNSEKTNGEDLMPNKIDGQANSAGNKNKPESSIIEDDNDEADDTNIQATSTNTNEHSKNKNASGEASNIVNKKDSVFNTITATRDSMSEANEIEKILDPKNTKAQKDGTSFVKNIELMTKTTLADKGDIRNSGSGSPFLQSSSYKSKDKNKKNIKKLPEFEGGDDALKDYIKGEIGKVKVKNIASYRTDFYLRFVIDNDGTMVTWKILGNIAPEVKEVVRLLMEEMPQWSPSTEKGKKGEVEYTYAIKLNENI